MDHPKTKKHVIEITEDTPVTLDLNQSIAEFIIVKAKAFDVKVAPVESDPGSDAIDDDNRGVIEDYPSDLTETELRDAIEGLTEDAKFDLLAVFWIGRGDFAATDWAEARRLAAERGTADLASYLMGEPSLGEFIGQGLAELDRPPAI